jgi:hypothetical protein
MFLFCCLPLSQPFALPLKAATAWLMQSDAATRRTLFKFTIALHVFETKSQEKYSPLPTEINFS